LNAAGALGAIKLRSLANGADVIAGSEANSSTSLVVGDVGTGSDVTVAGNLSATVRSVGDAQWTAASFGTLVATKGEFAATLTATAFGQSPSLASLSVLAGDLTANISVQGAVGDISVAGNASGQWNAQRFGNIAITGGNLSATIVSSGAVASLSVIGGDFTGDLFALGKVGNVSIAKTRGNGGNITGSTLTASGFGNIAIAKNLTDSHLLAGANFSADHALGGTGANADTFAAGKIGAVTVGGAVSKTIIAGGVDPTDSEYKDGNDLLLGTARTSLIKSFTAGSLDQDSFVAAYLLPAKAKIGRANVLTSLDSRFLSHASLGADFLTFKLTNDTGLYANDANSKDIATLVHVGIPGGGAGFRAAIDGGALKPLVVTPDASGNFTLSVAKLNAINGGTIPEGTHTLRVEVRTTDGSARVATFAFTLDNTAPTAAGSSVNLSLTSDTGTIGDGITSAAVVSLVGNIEPNAKITVAGKSALADQTGKFVIPNFALAEGANPLSFVITDRAGNDNAGSPLLATFTKTTATGGADVVLEWNAENLSAITRDASAPPIASRGLAMTSIAMFDVVSAFDGTAGYYSKVAQPDPDDVSIEAAIAAAAHKVLLHLYPGQQTALDDAFATSLARVTDGPAKTDGVTFGESIAQIIITIRSGDGFDTFVNYTPGNLPGDWQQTGPGFDVALLPQWATLTPFALNSASQFRPVGAPALDSAAYAAALNEVKDLGSATSATRTADQTQIARFWADGAGTITPPGHWNDIATDLAAAKGNSTASNARLLATLNVALADAGIAAWDAKYFDEFWRPITAIHDAENDGNAATAEDDAWQPLLLTPPFPEYVSGHSTYSAAAASVLGSFFGTSQSFDSTSPGLPGVTRTFANFDAAATGAGLSRIYGGIHFAFSNTDGLATGDKVGDFVVARFAAGGDTAAPLIMLDGLEDGAVFASFLAKTGHILDNLSGVATATAKFDKLDPIALTLDATGKFTLPAQTLAHGPHTLVVNATDAVGNAATPLTVHFTIDTQDPTLALTTPRNGDFLIAESRFNGQADGTGSPIVSLCYQFDGGPLIPILYDTTTGAFDIQPDLGDLAPGAHTLTIDALDAAGNLTTQTVDVTLDARIDFTVTEHTPQSFASEVGSTFRPQVFFSRPVDATSLNSSNFYATDTTGAVIPSTVVKEHFDASVPGAGPTFAWLFFTNPMPGASTVTVQVLGDTILAQADGQPLDGDADATTGGTLTYSFSTVSLTPLPGTSLSGKVVDPGVDLKPITFDDFRAGPDGIPHTAADVFLNPIADVKVFVVGLENLAVFTDAQGNFTLPSVPGGNVKLAVDSGFLFSSHAHIC
jgi:membrane-associated phospholipid phosphatase